MCEALEKPPFRDVYEEYYTYIFSIIRMRTSDDRTAEDLAQDVFEKALKYYDRYDPSRASVKTWLVRIATTRTIDHYRKDGRAEFVELDHVYDVGECDDYRIFKDEDIKKLSEILENELNNDEYNLIVMSYFLNMSNPAIGSALGISPKAVCERKRRIIRKLRKAMSKKKKR